MSLKKLALLSLFALAFTFTAYANTDAVDEQKEEVKTIVIEPIGNQMKFAQTEFTAAPGETIKLVFKNTATSAAMQHNVVFVTSEDAINRVGQAAMSAADTEYIPEDDAVFAYTPLAQPGQTVEVTFTAPEKAGSYPYICTFPGHYMMMQGTMQVK